MGHISISQTLASVGIASSRRLSIADHGSSRSDFSVHGSSTSTKISSFGSAIPSRLVTVFPGPQGIAGLVPDKKRIRASIDKLRDIKDPDRPLGQELHDIWRPIMESYTSAGLTRPTDRLIALDGIAKRLSEVYDCGYAAGLFTRNMESQLAWRLKRTGEPRTPDVDIAPSWSWARFPGRVDTLPQWESVDLDQESRRLTSEELRETQLCEIMNKEELAKAWSPICDSKELPLDVRCFMAEVRLLDFAEIKAWPKEEHRLVVWRREDADNGKGPVTSNDSLPLTKSALYTIFGPCFTMVVTWVYGKGSPECRLPLTRLPRPKKILFRYPWTTTSGRTTGRGEHFV